VVIPVCKDCEAALTPEEAFYYEDRCETCERVWFERMGRWRAGEPDIEFDALFNEPFG
jgi:hypothetical protein